MLRHNLRSSTYSANGTNIDKYIGLCYYTLNNIGKAMTEKVVYLETFREDSILVKAIYVKDLRKPFLSCNTEIQ